MNIHSTQMQHQKSIIGDNVEVEFCVQEREQAQMLWQQEQLHQQQQQLSYMINENNHMSMFSLPIQDFVSKHENTMGNGWNSFGVGDVNCTIPRTISCPPAVVVAMADAASLSSNVGKESIKKRKLDIAARSLKVNVEEETRDKKIKGCIQDVDSNITEKQSDSNNNNKEPSADVSQENSQVSQVKKLDYIHVRARRGEATDSHSLAERVRREKISERMRFLQDLVPGCNKVIGKAGMLDEIINYVQSLQTQVEFLSMKLASVSPTINYNIENLLNEEVNPPSTKEFSPIGFSSAMVDPCNLHISKLQVPCSGPETNVSPDMALCRTISAPVLIPETLLDRSYLNQIQHTSVWDSDLENLYAMEFQQGKLSSCTQSFTGYTEATKVSKQ